MGLITYTNIEDNTPITANVFNQRYGQIISVLNGGLDASNFKAGGIPVDAISQAVYEKMWPIGSVYINAADNTNPGTLLGFGTWEAYGAGQVPVGYDAGQTEFNAVNKIGGVKEVTLNINQIPSHSHGVNDPTHAHGLERDVVVTSAAGNSRAVNSGSGQQFAWSQINRTAYSTTGISLQNNGGGQAHTNLQPYTTVYMWRRTG